MAEVDSGAVVVVAAASVDEVAPLEAVDEVGSVIAAGLAVGVVREEGEVREVVDAAVGEGKPVVERPSSLSLIDTPASSSPAARKMPSSLSISAPASPFTARSEFPSTTRTSRRPTESMERPLPLLPRRSTESGTPSGSTPCTIVFYLW